MNATQIDLDNIGRLQQQLLPQPLPAFAGWDLAVHYEVGMAGGGDYYDVLPMDADHVGIVVADVSGHGPAAAGLTAMIRMLLHSCPITSGKRREPFCPVDVPCVTSPHIVLAHLNQTLVENSLDEQFMTMIFAIVNLSTGELQFSLAGHVPPSWWHGSSGTLTAFPDIGGLPLGVDAKASYQTATIQMAHGDLVVFSTDGLTESENMAGQRFERGRLEAGIHVHSDEPAEETKSSLMEGFHAFLNGAPVLDDLTLLVLKRDVNHECLSSEQFIG